MTITTIMFDWGGVLTKGRLSRDFARALADRYGVSYEQALQEFIGYDHQYCKGEIDGLTFAKGMATKLHIRAPPQEILDLFLHSFIWNDEMLGLAALLGKRYAVVIVSDNFREMREVIEKEERYVRTFTKRYYSFEHGMIKEDGALFRAALADLDVDPKECVFIDDRELNLPPARELGMKTVLFQDATQLEEELSLLGVSVRKN